MNSNKVSVKVNEYQSVIDNNMDNEFIYDIDKSIEELEKNLDKFDYLLSVGSGLLCGMIDILWIGEFNLAKERDLASKNINKFVKQSATITGWKGTDLKSAVKHLEDKFHIPSDGLTPEFGGGLQHHLRDFAHHPTITGLVFSLLTQFTAQSYGTDVSGNFIVVNVPKTSLVFIGNDVPSKLLYGVIYWFFHLVSDMAGSNSSVMTSGGTGLPGPILSFAKELSILPLFHQLKVEDKSLSNFISKIFNGTLFAQHDETGKIIKESVLRFDLRTEMGLVAGIGKMALPVAANEAIVRVFYLIRKFSSEIKNLEIKSIKDLKKIDWDDIKPTNNPSLARMLTISTGVFTAVDIGESIRYGEKAMWLHINYIGVGRFAVALNSDATWFLKARALKENKRIYLEIRETAMQRYNSYLSFDSNLDFEKFSLTREQTEILFNLEYLKTLNDISMSNHSEKVLKLKNEWLNEWKEYIELGFSNFIDEAEAEMKWFSEDELLSAISRNKSINVWFKLVLLEATLFEPYYPLGVEIDKKGNKITSKKYKELQKLNFAYNKIKGDRYLDSIAYEFALPSDFIKRVRNSHNMYISKLNNKLKKTLLNVSLTGFVTISSIALTAIFAPQIAVFLVGSSFSTLSGAALTSASLAYIGGGAIAVGGAGMAGGTLTLIGGGAILGAGFGTSLNNITGINEQLKNQNLILQSAKLLVSIKEIFIEEEHDYVLSREVFYSYKEMLNELKFEINSLKNNLKSSNNINKKVQTKKISNLEESVKIMNSTITILKSYAIKTKKK